MPDISGTNISAPIRPYSTEQTFPVAYTAEIAGSLKFVETAAELSAIFPERRPRGTVASVGIGAFKQWTGTTWQTILEGLSPPEVTYSVNDVTLEFTGKDVKLPAATDTNAGVLTASLYKRIKQHNKTHLENGDDAIASVQPATSKVPQADNTGKLHPAWFPLASQESAGIVRIAENGTSPADLPGEPISVVRANDSRFRDLAELCDLFRNFDDLNPNIFDQVLQTTREMVQRAMAYHLEMFH